MGGRGQRSNSSAGGVKAFIGYDGRPHLVRRLTEDDDEYYFNKQGYLHKSPGDSEWSFGGRETYDGYVQGKKLVSPNHSSITGKKVISRDQLGKNEARKKVLKLAREARANGQKPDYSRVSQEKRPNGVARRNGKRELSAEVRHNGLINGILNRRNIIQDTAMEIYTRRGLNTKATGLDKLKGVISKNQRVIDKLERELANTGYKGKKWWNGEK